ncbi:MAG: zinc ribbon domain-containing protein [Candidatus Schekmanbacteria bacterium]|nr:zinc ribbon domain-containing protein [Candidatus Schekmanbacteria bacterium]
MPNYEYKCAACEQVFLRIQAFSDPPIEVCPQCGGAVRKVLSPPALVFKGTGWYVTDYGRGGKSDRSGAPRKDNGHDTKSDAKGESSGGDAGSAKTAPASTASSGSGD